jgi:hypothetical protein
MGDSPFSSVKAKRPAQPLERELRSRLPHWDQRQIIAERKRSLAVKAAVRPRELAAGTKGRSPFQGCGR